MLNGSLKPEHIPNSIVFVPSIACDSHFNMCLIMQKIYHFLFLYIIDIIFL